MDGKEKLHVETRGGAVPEILIYLRYQRNFMPYEFFWSKVLTRMRGMCIIIW